MLKNNPIQIFQSADGVVQLSVSLEKESVWLSQAQMTELFDKNKRTVSEHIRNIFKEGELCEETVVRKFRTTAADGKAYETNHYNLDFLVPTLQRGNPYLTIFSPPYAFPRWSVRNESKGRSTGF